MASSSRTLLFTGSPSASNLGWTSNDGLLDSFEPRISHFLKLPHATTDLPVSSTAPEYAAWRNLLLGRPHLRTGHSQMYEYHLNGHQDFDEETGTSFLSTSALSPSSNEDSNQNNVLPLQPSNDPLSSSSDGVLSQFYEQSFALHADVTSSQINRVEGTEVSTQNSSILTTSTSFNSTTLHTQVAPVPPPHSIHVLDLDDLPPASHLVKISPQTMTVNLIVGIISTPPARKIQTKRGDSVYLMEILLGDETRSGFTMNFWLNDNDACGSEQLLSRLRPQDIILLRNVALNSFRGKVFGQSLRKGMTRCDLLFRYAIDKTDLRGSYGKHELYQDGQRHPQVEKTRRVRDWVLKFVGRAPRRPIEEKRLEQQNTNGKRTSRSRSRVEILPPDTQ